jgi:hypothetical protein
MSHGAPAWQHLGLRLTRRERGDVRAVAHQCGNGVLVRWSEKVLDDLAWRGECQ